MVGNLGSVILLFMFSLTGGVGPLYPAKDMSICSGLTDCFAGIISLPRLLIKGINNS